MIIKDKIIYADEGYTLRRIADKEIVGSKYWLGYIYYWGGKLLPKPKLEVPEDFDEVSLVAIEAEERREHERQYPINVERYIRERYTISDELAIQRQKETKPEAFQEYFEFCEECKKRAREELGL